MISYNSLSQFLFQGCVLRLKGLLTPSSVGLGSTNTHSSLHPSADSMSYWGGAAANSSTGGSCCALWDGWFIFSEFVVFIDILINFSNRFSFLCNVNISWKNLTGPILFCLLLLAIATCPVWLQLCEMLLRIFEYKSVPQLIFTMLLLKNIQPHFTALWYSTHSSKTVCISNFKAPL